MRVWLVKEGEPLPSDNSGDRLFRMGMLAEQLARNGHEVVWWSSTFNHAKKIYRFREDKQVAISDNYKLELLHSISYKRNISIKRVIHQSQTARKFAKQARAMPKPDVIFCAMPTIDFAIEATKFGLEENIPIILDIRDLWPDIYEDYFPASVKPFIRLLSTRSRRALSRACHQAFAITGLTQEYLNWAIDYAGRPQSDWDRVFTLGYKRMEPNEQKLAEGFAYWSRMGLQEGDFIVCFFGQIGHAVDLETVIQAVSQTQAHKRIKYVICGIGEKLENLKAKANGLNNVYFPGWVGAYQIQALMKIASAGILPYKLSKNYENNIPNKFAEYLSEGLPLLVSVRGLMTKVCEENQIGYYYGNAGQLAERLKEMESIGHLDQMSENAKAVFHRMFEAEKIYKDMAQYLENVAINKEVISLYSNAK